MSAESAASAEQNEHYLRVLKRRFRDWRGTRPFWAGLFTLLGGIPIAYFPYASLHLGQMTLSMATTGGAGSLIIGVLLVTLGLTMWFQPIVRVFAGVASILLGLVSIPVANFGGLAIGFLLALVGGAMSLAWAPGQPEAGLPEVRQPDAQQPAEASAPVMPGTAAGAAPGPAAPTEAAAQYGTDTTVVDANGGRNSAG
ncbi:hypothetical protein BJP40_07470 [Streptomyces sp. CC53]|uniref:DUF6114 domain-containing protein n=1 Tax=unclassified Streptomyces TaxID=2593676 RepID=UPI0008DE0EDA|nr:MULTISPECIES: DUF6114 domain-containing protein [unclassified Streptomyces]OII60995.1 hypothetical protein BJP40_07470 [Streptomyces sp. CC53]OII66970.1 hypothetical protein BJP39_07570 [Streptomyces sp. CC77]